MGRNQFDRQTIITATTGKSIQMIAASSAQGGTLPYGNVESYVFYSPKNTISKVLDFTISWPAVTSGTTNASRYLTISQQDPSANLPFKITYMYTTCLDCSKDFTFSNSIWLQNNTTTSNIVALPSNDASALIAVMQGMTFDENIGLEFQFQTTQSSPVDNSQRQLVLFVEQEVVAT